MKELMARFFSELKRCSWNLLLTGLIYRVLALVLIAPIASALFRVMMTATGKTTLTDQDILFFFVSPSGLLSLVVIGAINMGVMTLELTAMMYVIASPQKRGAKPVAAIHLAVSRLWKTVQVAGRAIAIVLMWSVPFVIGLGLVYLILLGEFDINFYLSQKPSEFWLAIGIALVLVAVLGTLLVRLFLSWFFAIPIVAFESEPASHVLRESGRRTSGQYRSLLIWLLAWLGGTVVASSLATMLLIWIGKFLFPGSQLSLAWILFAAGLGVCLWSLVHFGISLLSNASLSILIYQLYVLRGGGQEVEKNVAEDLASDSGFSIRLTRWRLVGFTLVGVVVAMGVSYFLLYPRSAPDKVNVIAHRGASFVAPENTMAAFKQAINDGADFVELDVQEIADGTVVVFHDSDFMKLSNNKLKIWEATPKDLETIDIGSWFDPRFSSERVPTLDYVLDYCKGKVGVFIELKYYGHNVELEKKVVELVESKGMADDVVIISLKADGIRKVKELRPDWKTGQLMSVHAGDLAKLDADMLAVNSAFASRQLIQASATVDKQVVTWTVNDSQSMYTMLGRGVSGLITDRPDLARTSIQQYSELRMSEKMLLNLVDLLGLNPPRESEEE